MPIYEYQCQECGHKLEVMQRITEDLLKTCPSCSKDGLKKLMSKVAFQLKGTGWYETDFKDKGKPPAKKEGEADKEGAKESKSETKKDASSDTKKSNGETSGKASSSTAGD
ncbi:MAG: zinc ribbon domain-containing protein [Gammaproteobacteria bacterium]|nr:zinc ribbon domain-containing protein [Gammaproteobacteria bacterium]